MRKRVVAFLFAFSVYISLFPLAHADYINTPQSYWDRLLHRAVNSTSILGFQSNAILGQFFGAVCETSSDGFHHSETLYGAEMGTDSHGDYALTTCRYCGKSFKVYGSDLESAYQDYTSSLPS